MPDRRLRDHLEHALAELVPGPILVALSGGLDSTTLLHALARSRAARERGLRAVHVDHRLHADSAKWSRRCAELAEQLDVPLETREVEVARAPGLGLEATARRVRYAAIEAMLGDGEILALGHHRDDQAETVLLKLLRGAGPEGLGGMRDLRGFGAGHLWRPLLAESRSTLLAYAHEYELHWLDDPSNSDMTLRRNFLRGDILPRLRTRWRDADAALAHSAVWARSAADFIDGEARKALVKIQGLDPATLFWRDWLALPDALRDPVLRLWLRELRLDEPAHFHVAELERQLRDSGEDRLPCVRFGDSELRRYRDLLYALRPLPAVPVNWETQWDGSGTLALPVGGQLELAPPQKFEPPLVVRYRRGGERIRPAGSAHTRELRLLLQEAGMPPWLRGHIPLVFRDGELIAVGDLFFNGALADSGTRIRFDPPAAP